MMVLHPPNPTSSPPGIVEQPGVGGVNGGLGFSAVPSAPNGAFATAGGGREAPALTGNPNFVAPGTDFHLLPGPAVDVGSSSVASTVTTDFDVATARPQKGGFDLGAYER